METAVSKYANRWTFLLALLLISLAVISRKPDLVTNPQFMGDECIWFSEAWFTGPWHAIIHPQAGYLCLASKLPLLLAIHVPLADAPAVFDWYTIGIEVLLAGFLLSDRLAPVAGLGARGLLVFLCVALPNSAEVESLNNTQWMLAVLCLLILFSSPPKTAAGKAFDIVAVALISVTGPFCLLLLPIACLLWWFQPLHWTAGLACIIGAGCGIQLFTLAHALPPCRPMDVLNPLGIRILSGQIFFFGALHGGTLVPKASEAMDIAAVVLALGLSVGAYAFWKGPKQLKLFILFAVLICVSVARRLHCDTSWTWQSLMSPEYAIRYWYIPRLAVIAVLVWLLGRARPLWLRTAGALAVITLALFAVTHWRYSSWPNFHWRYYAQLVERSPRGTTVWIPVNPPGWRFFLVSR